MRPRRWQLLTSRLTLAQYEEVQALAASSTAIVQAHATFLRSDGQGTLFTIWARNCCVSTTVERFDSRGQDGEPSWWLYIELAPEEMGKVAGGTPGAFVIPPPRSYAYSGPPVAMPGPIKHTGGKGPDGMGDAVGVFSGRRYDPENCGGPIRSLSWRDATITAAGIAQVEKHTSRYGEDPENQAMIDRLKNIVAGKAEASDWDLRYYTHELREYERYRAMGIADGEDPGRELWNHAHTATLEDFQLADYNDQGIHNLYHPSI